MLRRAVTAGSALFFAGTACAVSPNIVIIYADDVGWADIGCYQKEAQTPVRTPNIDSLARSGMRFTDAHSSSLCAPSRYSVLTGNYPFRSPGIGWSLWNRSSVADDQQTMAAMLKEAGYHTAFFGKWHMGGRMHDKDGNPLPHAWKPDLDRIDWTRPVVRGPTSLGFDYSFWTHSGIQHEPYFYFENDVMVGDPNKIIHFTKGTRKNSENKFLTGFEAPGIGLPDWDSTKTGERFTRKALEFLDRHAEERTEEPFFIHFCTQCIHSPLTPGEFMGQPVAGVTGHPYTDMIYEMDLQVGALMQKLEQLGALENTIVILTSDNGPWEWPGYDPPSYNSSAQWRGRKGEAYEAGHRVAFIIRWGDGTAGNSKVSPGTVCDRLICQTDLFPSLAAISGGQVASDQALDGADISPYFFGDESRVLRDRLFVRGRFPEGKMGDFSESGFSYRRDGFKILASFKNGQPGPVTEMYCIDRDSSEQTNLMANPEYKTLQNKLFAELMDLWSSTRSTAPNTRRNEIK